MRNRLWLIIPLLLLTGFAITGLTRLRFETNILEILPKDIPSVEALKVSQEHFDNDQQVVLLLESAEEEILEEDVAELAEWLRKKLAPAKVLYKAELEENPAALAEGLAVIWRGAPPEEVAKLAARVLDPQALEAHLENVKQEIRTSFDQQESTMSAYDPLGFLQHPAIQQLMGSEFSFQSEDGKSQLLLITGPEGISDYNAHAAWIAEIRGAARSWPGLEETGLTFRLTGGPVFNAEIGAGMEQDMSGTVMLTSIAMALLFLLVQRHPGQLLIISLLLVFTFLLTLGIGGWVFGTLNLVSVGFAAILLGLVIDYGVVIFREAVGELTSPESLRREVAPGILWAAATTAVVFGLLTMSTFHGVRQLGGLIVIGLIVGAGVMLIFTPMFLGRFPSRLPRHLLKAPFAKAVAARLILGTCLLISLISFVSRGAPKISFDFSMVEPSSSEAAAAFDAIKEDFPAWSERNHQLIASADSWEELREVAMTAQAKLRAAQNDGIIEHYQWPLGFIPESRSVSINQETLQTIGEKREEILAVLTANGFSESGTALSRMVLNSLADPEPPGELSSLAGQFISVSQDGSHHLSGSVKSTEPITEENIADLAHLSDDHVTLTGWPVLQADLLPSVTRDFYMIFLPAGAALLLTLWLVFRSVRDAAISIAVLLTALVLLNAFVVASGQTWNFLSGMAIPLIIGTGIDYSIHLIFSLRRSGGDFNKVWNSVGKAICFCGISTAIGFGSLLFASNEMLRSMGLLCSLGVLLTTLLSVLVVPGLWQRARH